MGHYKQPSFFQKTLDPKPASIFKQDYHAHSLTRF